MKLKSTKRQLIPSGLKTNPTSMTKPVNETEVRPSVYTFFIEKVDGKDKLVPAHTMLSFCYDTPIYDT